MSFYWVNIGGTYKEVAAYKFLWAPAYTFRKGKKVVVAGWIHVPHIIKGDIIFCHRDGKIIYVAVAKKNAYAADRPESRKYKEWETEGYKVDLDLVILDAAVSIKDFKDTLFELYNERCNPRLFTGEQKTAQNYMISIPEGAGALLLDAIGNTSLIIQAKANQTDATEPATKPTQREAIIQSRIGQGKFRENVLYLWNNTCPVTGVNAPDLLIASHIVSWQLSTDFERLDKFNGLPLSPSVDKLFDKGYISFSDKGEILINENISIDLLKKLGIDPNSKLIGLDERSFIYLERHRSIFGFQIEN